MNIYAADAVKRILGREIGLQAVLKAFSGVRWHRLPKNGWASLPAKGLSYRAIVLPGKAPPFSKRGSEKGAHSIAYQFHEAKTGGRMLVAPDASEITEPLREAMEESDAVIFDGTFWSPDELGRVKKGAVAAGKMGHLPICGGSLEVLAKLRARHKIYIHINNTNPILARRSPQRSEVEAAGIMIGEDGYAFEV